MKKLFLIMCALSLTMIGANAAENAVNPNPDKCPICKHKPAPEHMKKGQAFEKKLGLTEEQKTQARELRKQGFEKMKPVMEQIKAKKQEVNKIKKSNIALKDQDEQLKKLDKEIKNLEKQAREIRKDNMKEFENILTKEQKKTLKQMKQEGRKNFKANHPNGRPPMPPCKFEESNK